MTWKEEANLFDFVKTENYRVVPPYNFTYTTRVKERWIGKPLSACLAEEFPHYPTGFFEEASRDGRLRLNGLVPSSPHARLRGCDVVTHLVHRHEPPVSSAPLRLVASNALFLAIDKPSSVPVHPGGRFRRTTVLGILAREGALLEEEEGARHELAWELHPVHRLDRLTSGLLLLARSPAAADALRRSH